MFSFTLLGWSYMLVLYVNLNLNGENFAETHRYYFLDRELLTH
jgi:hypothetical protein